MVSITARPGTSDTINISRANEAIPLSSSANSPTQAAQDFPAGTILEIVDSAGTFDLIEQDIDNLQTFQNTTVPATYLTIADYQNGQKIWGASSGGTDAYAITPSPAIVAYANGQKFSFIADVGNTGGATLNVNGLGAKTILKQHDQPLVTGDIEAGQVVDVSYDGTNFQMASQIATVVDLSGYTTRTETMTLGEDVIAGDSVYPSAADTVKKVYPTAMGTGAAVTTSPAHANPRKVLQISNGVVLNVTGNDG